MTETKLPKRIAFDPNAPFLQFGIDTVDKQHHAWFRVGVQKLYSPPQKTKFDAERDLSQIRSSLLLLYKMTCRPKFRRNLSIDLIMDEIEATENENLLMPK